MCLRSLEQGAVVIGAGISIGVWDADQSVMTIGAWDSNWSVECRLEHGMWIGALDANWNVEG